MNQYSFVFPLLIVCLLLIGKIIDRSNENKKISLSNLKKIQSPEQPEALSWLQHNHSKFPALAGNRFQSTLAAIKFVERLYAQGAKQVSIDNVYQEDWRIQEMGGPYADSLIITLPDTKNERIEIFKVVNQEYKKEGLGSIADTKQEQLALWWD